MKEDLLFRQLSNTILEKYKDKPVIKVITGIRRAGKSFILRLIKQNLQNDNISSDDIVYIDFEDFENINLDTPEKLYDYIKTSYQNKKGNCLYLLFDEIQELNGWEKCINSLYSSSSMNCDIYITGSNAKLLSSELSTYISGRYIQIPVFPLSYKEYLLFNKTSASSESFMQFLKYGGFPGLSKMNYDDDSFKSYIQGIYSTVLLKDVITRNKIRDTDILEKIIFYVIDNIGNIFSAKRIADFMKSTGRALSVETVYNDLNALQGALFLYKVPRYDLKGKKLLETMEKYYIADSGLRFALLGFKDTAINGLLENIVYIELLRRGYSVTIGKFDSVEIDFVAEKSGSRSYFQVCYLMNSEETIKREYSSLKLIKDNFPKTILTLDDLPEANDDGILRKNLIEWLLEE
jgi:predicted AAA+ superfamily ATPase